MVGDLIEALRNDVDPYECRELFKAGPVHERLHDLIWNRTHGPEKRAQVIRTLLQRDGFAAQRDLVGRLPWNEMPAITLDIAMVVVEGALRIAGVSGGASREEIRAAMDDLVHTFDAVAVPEYESADIMGVAADSRSRPGSCCCANRRTDRDMGNRGCVA